MKIIHYVHINIHEGINVNYRCYLLGRVRREKVVLSCHDMKSVKIHDVRILDCYWYVLPSCFNQPPICLLVES
jgi:hypothetical protein